LCDAKNRPYIVGVTTVLSSWKDKDDKIRFSKRLLVAKTDAKDILVRRQRTLGSLKGKLFNFYRGTGKTTNSIGTDIEFEKDVDLNQLEKYCPEGIDFNEWIKPFDYIEIFKPKKVDDLKEIVSYMAKDTDEISGDAKVLQMKDLI